MLTKSKLIQLAVILLILLGLVFWRTESVLRDVTNAPGISAEQTEATVVRCDYLSSCEFVSKQGKFGLTVNNPPIQAERWINFSLQSELSGWRVTEAEIVGKSMFMGRIPVFFKSADKDIYSARAMVPACTSAEMTWQLQISVVADNIKEVLRFDFAVRD